MFELTDLIDFSITSWYEKFRHICLKTIIIPIPPELLKELRSDNCEINIDQVCSEKYINELRNAINYFSNNAFVKTNWRAPVDSKFISFGNSLKVTNIADMLLYLTASEIALNDFDNSNFNDYCFALRKWINIHPASEFRCIVINDVLRGITPKDWPTFYAHFLEEGPSLIKTIQTFFEENIKEKFSRKNYTFDIINNFEDSVKLVDFGPLNTKTNLYAFSWKEIQKVINKNDPSAVMPVFRFLESDMGIMMKGNALLKIANTFNEV